MFIAFIIGLVLVFGFKFVDELLFDRDGGLEDHLVIGRGAVLFTALNGSVTCALELFYNWFNIDVNITVIRFLSIFLLVMTLAWNLFEVVVYSEKIPRMIARFVFLEIATLFAFYVGAVGSIILVNAILFVIGYILVAGATTEESMIVSDGFGNETRISRYPITPWRDSMGNEFIDMGNNQFLKD